MADDDGSALVAERDFLLASLRDLEAEHDAGDVDHDDYVRLKDAYTARAADVLRAIDGDEPPRAPQAAPASTRWVLRAGVAALVLVFAIGAGLLVANRSGERLAGDSATGDIASSVNRMLAEASALTSQGDLVGAIKKYVDVRRVDPDNREALAYQGWLMVRTGEDALVPQGEALIARAVTVDPSYADARVFAGIVALRNHDDAKTAEEHFDAFYASDPPAQWAELVRQTDAEARDALGLPPRFAESGSTSVPS